MLNFTCRVPDGPGLVMPPAVSTTVKALTDPKLLLLLLLTAPSTAAVLLWISAVNLCRCCLTAATMAASGTTRCSDAAARCGLTGSE